ncbi:putative PLATZ transcription factor family protein [Melia azedarach]|uniref:PLATZ transcription factor family protein n=1 Tax=Melia azedarach TaxID=155640 RepID=A0ACC1XF77_MELAZ|nr:putative PLATZ transcription factor family protein [Melia azedarach]
MVGCKFIIKKKKAIDWLNTLLQSQFFDLCIEHQSLKKNEKNVFCIDCNTGCCRNCESSHRRHRRLQICKYVYQDVVRLQDMQKHLDCSRIQTYKINGEKAVHLNPRPQLKDAKPSTKSKTGASCEACGRFIQELPNRFCSIACKLFVIPLSPKEQSSSSSSQSETITIPMKIKNMNPETSTSDKESSLTQIDQASDDSRQACKNPALRPRSNMHKRKGKNPRRAHLC